MSKASLYPPLIFNVYKPKGPTSGEVLNHFKRHLPRGFGKIGHFGTLDPFAQGVFLIAIAGAQRMNDFVHEQCLKTYIARGKIGIQTNTADEQGEVLSQSDPQLVRDLCLQQVKVLEQKFRGTYWQGPPAFSALKHQGRPLYEYARAGVMIEKPKVERFIHELRILSLDQDKNELCFEVTASSGTYIRTLFEDMMLEFNLCGHLLDLTRTRIGPVSMEDSLHLKDWPSRESSDQLDYPLLKGMNVQSVLPWPVIHCDEHSELMFRRGVSQRIEQLLDQPQGDGPHWFEGSCLLGASAVVGDSWRQLFQF